MATPIISTTLLEDVLCTAAPDLVDAQPADTKALVAVLRPALNLVVKSHRTPSRVPIVIASQRARIAACSTAVAAFDLFVSNMTDV